jgi:hypothetical protein
MPAEIRNIETQGQTRVQQVIRAVDFEILAVYMNGGHFVTN